MRLATTRARAPRHNRRPDWPYRVDPGSEAARAGSILDEDRNRALILAAWPMGVESAGGGLRDLGPGGYDATLNGGAAIVVDPEMTACVDFSAAGAYAERTATGFPNGPFDQAQATISIWFRTAQTIAASTAVEIMGRHGTTSNEGFGLDLNNFLAGAPLQFYAKSGSTQVLSLVSTSTGLNDGRWHHVAVQSDRRAGFPANLFLDGRMEATATVSSSTWGYNNDSPIRWGVSLDGFWQRFSGQLADCRIVPGWLADATIARLAAPRTRWDLYEPPRQARLDLVATGRFRRVGMAGGFPDLAGGVD